MARICHVRAREVLDSRGRPTVEVEVHVDVGGQEGRRAMGRAIVPSGASTGRAEAWELRDAEDRYDGLGVQRAVANVVEQLGPAVVGMDPQDQHRLDARLLELDDSPRKSRLGANAILGVSLAAAHASAAVQGVPLYRHLHDLWRSTCRASSLACDLPQLPLPIINMISGGLHAGGNLDFQDVLIAPHGAPDYPTQLEWTVRIYRRLGKLLDKRGFDGRLVGDEGGYGPRLDSNRQAVQLVVEAIEEAGLQPGRDVSIALDVAATQFYAPEDQTYCLGRESGQRLSSSQLIDLLEQWVDEFPIRSIEDGLAEDDWDGWHELTRRLDERVQLVGDDLFTTNVQRVRRGITSGVANAVLVKVNQIGTLSETLETMVAARHAGYSLVVSARSGETEDTTIADLATAVAAEQIKIGSIVRSERLAKYNQLLRIASQLAE